MNDTNILAAEIRKLLEVVANHTGQVAALTAALNSVLTTSDKEVRDNATRALDHVQRSLPDRSDTERLADATHKGFNSTRKGLGL